MGLWRRFSSGQRELTLAVCIALLLGIVFLRQSAATCGVVDVHRVSGDSSPSLLRTSVASTSSRGSLERPVSKYAFVSFLAPTETEEAGGEEDEDNVYMTSMRMLIYQLLHDPLTRTNTSIAFVVLVSPGVPQSKRKRLEQEGAFVAEFPSINLSTNKPGRSRWKHVMDKLNVFKLTQFEKILLLDTDIVVFKCLDAIFEEPETIVQINRRIPEHTKDDEGKQPERYLLAADSSPIGSDKHGWPAPRGHALNAGFVVLQPSEEMFDHYIKIASIEGRTPMVAPENNLLEYVHRAEGNMPWSQIQDTWIMNHPVYRDYEMGIAAVHEKWYRNSMTDVKLREVLVRVRWKMEGFWNR